MRIGAVTRFGAVRDGFVDVLSPTRGGARNGTLAIGYPRSVSQRFGIAAWTIVSHGTAASFEGRFTPSSEKTGAGIYRRPGDWPASDRSGRGLRCPKNAFFAMLVRFPDPSPWVTATVAVSGLLEASGDGSKLTRSLRKADISPSCSPRTGLRIPPRTELKLGSKPRLTLATVRY